MAPLPSWIQGESSQFSDAYAHGAQQGLALAEMRDRITARNQQHQLQLEEMQSREAERAAAAMERQKEFDARQGLSRDSASALKDYRDAQLDIHKAGLGLQAAHFQDMRKKADEIGAPLGGPEVLTDPETQARVGLRIPISKSSAHFQADKGFGKEGALSDVQKVQLKQLDELQKENRALAAKSPSDTDTQAALSRRLLQLEQQRQSIIHPTTAAPISGGPLGAMPMTAPAPEDASLGNFDAAVAVPGIIRTNPGGTMRAPAAGVMVRRKKDGKTFRYKGDASEVPTDAYDILQ